MGKLRVCSNGHRMWIDEPNNGEIRCSVCGLTVPDVDPPESEPTAHAAPTANDAATDILTCANGHRMWLPQNHPARVVCAVCGTVVRDPPPTWTPPTTTTASANGANAPTVLEKPAPEQAPTDKPPDEEWSDEDLKALRRVHKGLGYHYARMVFHLLTIEAVMLGVILTPLASRSEVVETALNVGAVVVVIWFFAIAWVLGIAGSVLCLSVPAEVGPRRLIWCSLLFDLAKAPLFLLMQFVLTEGYIQVEAAETVVDLSSSLRLVFSLVAMFAAWICFMLFLKNIASNLDEPQAEDEAKTLLVLGLALGLFLSAPLVVVPLVALYLTMILAGSFAWVVAMLAVFFLFYIVIKLFLRLLAFVGRMRQVIGRRAGNEST